MGDPVTLDVLRPVTAELGVLLLRASTDQRLVIALPSITVAASLDGQLDPESIMRTVSEATRQLFRIVIDHIAKHDRSPLDRLKQVEECARKALPRNPDADTGNQRELRLLLTHKPGAISWRRNGYGEDPK